MDSNESIPEWLLTFNGIIVLLIAVIGVLANALTIGILLDNPQIRNAAAYFIISLSTGDLIFSLIVLPLTGISLLGSHLVVENKFLCTFVPFVGYGNVGVSFFSVVLITFNRYIKIAHHHIHDKIYKPRNIAIMIASAWLSCYGLQIPTIFKSWGMFGYDQETGTCDILDDKNGNSNKKVIFGIGFILPCIVIILCYARILYVVQMSELRIRDHVLTLAVTRKRKEFKRTLTVFVIFITFLVCFLPIAIIKVVDEQFKYPGLHVMGYILLHVSTFTNPIIYVVMNKTYRKACRSTIQKILSICISRGFSRRETSQTTAKTEDTSEL